jgi:hypothetical protein
MSQKTYKVRAGHSVILDAGTVFTTDEAGVAGAFRVGAVDEIKEYQPSTSATQAVHTQAKPVTNTTEAKK